MSEYISRETAISKLRLVEIREASINFPAAMLSELKSIPAADVVEVVRCRDCVYWEPASPTRTSGNCNRSFEITAWATDFCSCGERKDGGQEDV